MMLEDNKDFAKQMNTIVFHTKMVDALDEILLETSDLSIFCFYRYSNRVQTENPFSLIHTSIFQKDFIMIQRLYMILSLFYY